MAVYISILCSEFINKLKKYTPSTQWDIIFTIDCDNKDMNIHECIVQSYQDSYHYNIFMKHRDSEVDFYKKIIESESDKYDESAREERHKYEETCKFIYDEAPNIKETNFKLMICENKNRNIIKYYIGLFRTIFGTN